MRVFMLSLFFLSLVCRVSAQISVVQIDRGYIAYVGIEHTIGIAVDGYPSSALIVTVDNGSIDRHYIAGQYTITPKHPGDSLTITVQAKTKAGIKEVKKFRVKLECIPIESTTFCGRNSGETITSGLIQVSSGLDWGGGGFEMSPRFKITGFKVRVIRGGEEILSKSVFDKKGVGFSSDEEVLNVMSNIEAGDRIIFTNITYLGYGECTGTMKSMDFVAN